MKFNNKNRGYSQLYWVIADKMNPYTLSVYYLIKSYAGFKSFGLSIRQIAQRCGMSFGKAQESFKKIKEIGLIKLSKQTSYFEADEYDVCDDELAMQLDPDGTYNNNRFIE